MHEPKNSLKHGFTLIELMIVVAIIGILAAIAVPKFAELLRKSNEGACKGSLGALRSALSIYYGDMEGQYPDDMTTLTISTKYLNTIPLAKAPVYHGDSNSVVNGVSSSDNMGWAYNNDNTDNNHGSVMVNCTHTDTKGTVWTSY